MDALLGFGETAVEGIPSVVAHVGFPGPAPFIAMGLFFVGMGAAYGAYWCFKRPPAILGRASMIGLGILACGCFVLATAFPLFLGARPSLGRPSTTATLEIVEPPAGESFRGDPATIPVHLRLAGATVVPFTSLRLVPNEGHIHLFLDGGLVSMTTGLDARITAAPGEHELRAEFVAVDHSPFQPRVVAAVTFSVHA